MPNSPLTKSATTPPTLTSRWRWAAGSEGDFGLRVVTLEDADGHVADVWHARGCVNDPLADLRWRAGVRRVVATGQRCPSRRCTVVWVLHGAVALKLTAEVERIDIVVHALEQLAQRLARGLSALDWLVPIEVGQSNLGDASENVHEDLKVIRRGSPYVPGVLSRD